MNAAMEAVAECHGWSKPVTFGPGDTWTADVDGIRISGIVPAPIRILSDQILVKCLPDDDRMHGQSRILLPPTADRGYLAIKTGVVVALGCGDVVAVKCWVCDGRTECASCSGTGFLPDPERTEFTVQVGDRVLYHPRDWAEWTHEGQKYIVLHEDQGVLGVLSDDAVVFADNESTRSKGVDFDGPARLTNFSKGKA